MWPEIQVKVADDRTDERVLRMTWMRGVIRVV